MYAIIQKCCELYFRGLRGVRVDDNKDQPNFSLSLEDTANQLWGYIYIYTHTHIYTIWLHMKIHNCNILHLHCVQHHTSGQLNLSFGPKRSIIIFLNVTSASLHVWTTGLSQNIGGRTNEISSYIV